VDVHAGSSETDIFLNRDCGIYRINCTTKWELLPVVLHDDFGEGRILPRIGLGW
jgi:hypothetical protein